MISVQRMRWLEYISRFTAWLARRVTEANLINHRRRRRTRRMTRSNKREFQSTRCRKMKRKLRKRDRKIEGWIVKKEYQTELERRLREQTSCENFEDEWFHIKKTIQRQLVWKVRNEKSHYAECREATQKKSQARMKYLLMNARGYQKHQQTKTWMELDYTKRTLQQERKQQILQKD